MAQQVATAKRRTARKLSTSKCELLDTGRNKMYAERTAGRFTEMDDARPLLDGGPSDDCTDVHEGHSPHARRSAEGCDVTVLPDECASASARC